jgi:hypothetical protein
MGTPVRIKQQDGGGSTSVRDLGLTLLHPFFGEPKRFELLVENWSNYPQRIKDELQIIMVDDHGAPSLKSLITPEVEKKLEGVHLTVYRIEDDLKHNTPGSLNLGFMLAATPYILTMDSDCTFLPGAMEKVMELKPMKDWMYKFDRLRVTENEDWAKNTRYLPCTMLMHKDMFLDINGFDEDYTGTRSGGYGFFDTHFDYKIEQHPDYHIGRANPGIVVTEWMSDVCGDFVPRTYDEDRVNRKLFYQKRDGDAPLNNEILRFAWKMVFRNG